MWRPIAFQILSRPAPRPPAFLNAPWYRALYPDVAASGIPPLFHYLRHGQREGRVPCQMVADLWADDVESGQVGSDIGALESLAQSGEPADRLFAAIACTRWFAARGKLAEAARYATLAAQDDRIVTGFLDPSLPLTAGMILLDHGHRERGKALLERASRRFPRDPNLRLSIAATGQPLRPLRLWYLGHGLRAAGPVPGEGPPFDRLSCNPPQTVNGPLVTVLMAARNAQGTIATALQSLARQSWRNLEILVIDNGSTDDTAGIVAHWAKRDPRVRLLDGARAKGAYGARNLGLAAATGDFVTCHDADDWAHPARIARQITPLACNPGLQATLSDWIRADDNLRPKLFWRQDRIIHPNMSSLLFRASLRREIGYWDEVPAGADSEYRDRIVARFGMAAIERVLPDLPLSVGRARPGSLTSGAATSIASQRTGPRADYAKAAAAWHKTGPLFLDRAPASRPFSVVPAKAGPSAASATQASPLASARRKIIVFAHAAGPDLYGAERSLLDTLSAARGAGVDAEIVVPEAASPDYLAALFPLVSRIHVHAQRLRRGGAPPTPGEVHEHMRLIEGAGAAEVHVNTCTLNAPLIAARALGRAAVLHLRELPEADPRLCRDLALSPAMLRTDLLDQADRIIANSQTTLDWIGPGKAILAMNRIDPALFDLPARPSGRLRIGLVGSGTPRKGLLDLVNIAQALRAEPGLEVLLVGPPPQTPLPPWIRAAGYVPTPFEAMGSCDMVLSLSQFAESFGRTVAEAMAAGRPVVAYDHGHPSALMKGGGGILVPPRNWRATARAIRRIARDSALYDRLSAEGRALAGPLAAPWPPALVGQIFGLGDIG